MGRGCDGPQRAAGHGRRRLPYYKIVSACATNLTRSHCCVGAVAVAAAVAAAVAGCCACCVMLGAFDDKSVLLTDEAKDAHLDFIWSEEDVWW